MGSDLGGEQQGQENCNAAARLACKHQLRGTGYRDGLRSVFTMREVRAGVQRKIFIWLIEYALTA